MDWSSWFRRRNRNPQTPNQSIHKQEETAAAAEEELGVTHQLIDHVKSFTVETFKNFPLKAEEEGVAGDSFGDEIISTSGTAAKRANVQKDLSKWQERHATLILSKVKELSQLRFKLCPRHLKEREFWRIYFTLVKSHVAVYELRAIQVETIKRMATEKDKYSNTGAFEVEMSETKQVASSDPPTP